MSDTFTEAGGQTRVPCPLHREHTPVMIAKQVYQRAARHVDPDGGVHTEPAQLIGWRLSCGEEVWAKDWTVCYAVVGDSFVTWWQRADQDFTGTPPDGGQVHVQRIEGN